jgi:hypothetical protein
MYTSLFLAHSIETNGGTGGRKQILFPLAVSILIPIGAAFADIAGPGVEPNLGCVE